MSQIGHSYPRLKKLVQFQNTKGKIGNFIEQHERFCVLVEGFEGVNKKKTISFIAERAL